MRLNRKQIRSLIMEEISVSRRQKPVNEGILAGLGVAAFAALAIAGFAGIQYAAIELSIDILIKHDPRVQAKLAELDNMVKENPGMSPADIARMAAQKDAELAAIIDEIRKGAADRASSAMGTTYGEDFI